MLYLCLVLTVELIQPFHAFKIVVNSKSVIYFLVKAIYRKTKSPLRPYQRTFTYLLLVGIMMFVRDFICLPHDICINNLFSQRSVTVNPDAVESQWYWVQCLRDRFFLKFYFVVSRMARRHAYFAWTTIDKLSGAWHGMARFTCSIICWQLLVWVAWSALADARMSVVNCIHK